MIRPTLVFLIAFSAALKRGDAQVDRRPDAQPRAGSPTSNYDPFKTGVQSVPTNVVLAAGSKTSIAEMFCEVFQFNHQTRAVTCGLSGSSQRYAGTLTVNFTDTSYWFRNVVIEQPMVHGVMQPWGVAVVAAYSTMPIKNVEFRLASDDPDAIWEQTQAARDVLKGTYNYPNAVVYPPAVHVREMQCHPSEFLVGKDQNVTVPPVYVITCALAGDQKYYGGYLEVHWHQFVSRIAEQNTPLPVPKALSTPDTVNLTQYVRVQHDTFGDDPTITYWGLTAFAIQTPEKRAFDRINFYPEREGVTWVPGQTPLATGTKRTR
jgi:hypothetical protein